MRCAYARRMLSEMRDPDEDAVKKRAGAAKAMILLAALGAPVMIALVFAAGYVFEAALYVAGFGCVAVYIMGLMGLLGLSGNLDRLIKATWWPVQRILGLFGMASVDKYRVWIRREQTHPVRVVLEPHRQPPRITWEVAPEDPASVQEIELDYNPDDERDILERDWMQSDGLDLVPGRATLGMTRGDEDPDNLHLIVRDPNRPERHLILTLDPSLGNEEAMGWLKHQDRWGVRMDPRAQHSLIGHLLPLAATTGLRIPDALIHHAPEAQHAQQVQRQQQRQEPEW